MDVITSAAKMVATHSVMGQDGEAESMGPMAEAVRVGVVSASAAAGGGGGRGVVSTATASGGGGVISAAGGGGCRSALQALARASLTTGSYACNLNSKRAATSTSGYHDNPCTSIRVQDDDEEDCCLHNDDVDGDYNDGDDDDDDASDSFIDSGNARHLSAISIV